MNKPFTLVFVMGVVSVGFAMGIVAYLASHNTGPQIEVRAMPSRNPGNLIEIDKSGNVVVVEPPSEVKTVLRHPLISGGLKNLNDFKAHVNRDPNLKRFYEVNGFDFSCVSQDTLDKNEWAQVTYRSSKDIRWSNGPLLLLKGETVFEDCHGHVIRAQCGNLVATVRKDEAISVDQDVSPLVETPETTEIASNTPIPSIGTPPQAPILPIDIEGGTEGGGDYGGYGGFYGGGGGTGTPQKTPEPGTGMLLGLGILVIVGLKRRQYGRKIA